jgi:hypothetical protein
MSSSPTRRTLEHLRKAGFVLVDVVEKWIPGANIRRDLFGIIDVLAVDANGAITGVQATSGDNVAARVAKITDSDAVHILRLAGWRIVVHGWRKNAKGRWVLREVDLS